MSDEGKEGALQKNRRIKEQIKEMETMLKEGVKVEVEALALLGQDYFSKEWIPRLIKEGDWI